MISVQNRLLQLNGNKIYLTALLLFSLILFSCGGPKPSTRNGRITSTDRENKRPVRPARGKVDTVKWTIVPESQYKPIKSDFGPVVKKLPQYNVALFLPFQSSSFNPSQVKDNEGIRFIHFYGGVKLALEKLHSERVPVHLSVYDTEGFGSTLKNKLRDLNKNTHLIIGPHERDQIMMVTEHGLKNSIPVISPWLASSRITSDNPFYIQLRPDLRDHYHRMVDDILKKYPRDQVVLLKKYDKSDANRIEYIQEYASSLLGFENGKPFKEFQVRNDSLLSSGAYMSALFLEDKETVFLLNNYSYEDEDYIYNVIRKLSGSKGLRKATLYGMPILMETDRLDFNLYNIMNIKVVMSRFISNDDPDIKTFRKSFYEMFGTLPTEEAYYGYDVMLYFGRGINKYGVYFQYFLDQDNRRMLHTKFDIQKVMTEPVRDHFKDINYFMNKHLDIIEIRNNRFHLSG
ncbi:MAG TPA: hypothetical protein PKC30_05885 [Saprospiraceae bacterium]|nr:hypothetical protein [Saprospiraceae bacterium]